LPHGLCNGDWVPFDLDNIDLPPPDNRQVSSVKCIYDVELPLLFIKSGSIIFVGPRQEWTDQHPLDPLILAIALDGKGQAKGTLYEDAGEGLEFQQGDYLMSHYCAQVVSTSEKSSDVKVWIEGIDGKRTRIKRNVIMKFYVLQDLKHSSDDQGPEQSYKGKFFLHVFQAEGVDGETITVKSPFRLPMQSDVPLMIS